MEEMFFHSRPSFLQAGLFLSYEQLGTATSLCPCSHEGKDVEYFSLSIFLSLSLFHRFPLCHRLPFQFPSLSFFFYPNICCFHLYQQSNAFQSTAFKWRGLLSFSFIFTMNTRKNQKLGSLNKDKKTNKIKCIQNYDLLSSHIPLITNLYNIPSSMANKTLDRTQLVQTSVARLLTPTRKKTAHNSGFIDQTLLHGVKQDTRRSGRCGSLASITTEAASCGSISL